MNLDSSNEKVGAVLVVGGGLGGFRHLLTSPSRDIRINKRLKQLVDQFCLEIKERFPDVEIKRIFRRDGDIIKIEVETPIENSWEISETMAERSTDILLDEGYYIIVVPLEKVRPSEA